MYIIAYFLQACKTKPCPLYFLFPKTTVKSFQGCDRIDYTFIPAITRDAYSCNKVVVLVVLYLVEDGPYIQRRPHISSQKTRVKCVCIHPAMRLQN